MMRRKPSARVASEGVTRTQQAIEDKLGWLFRNQPTEDYGIDAHSEVVDGEDVRGRLLALQIKSGESFFKESGPGGWWFRPDKEHVQYWLNHSLPVVVVLYHPVTRQCHWQLVNRATLEKTSTGGWKLLVPEAQVLDQGAAVPLHAAAEGDPYVLRIRELQLARPWMERRWNIYLGLASYAEVVPRLFAWANVSMHEETHGNPEHDEYEPEYVIFDSEEDDFTNFDLERDWQRIRAAERLRPYANGAGEVDFWRLELRLNELGKAFLVVDKFGMEGGRQLVD